jgi:hypothetical protein
MEDEFKLIKPFGKYKKGKVFESFGGLVCGISCDLTNKKINFDNKSFFKLIQKKYEKTQNSSND